MNRYYARDKETVFSNDMPRTYDNAFESTL